jgi:hypothetical protein
VALDRLAGPASLTKVDLHFWFPLPAPTFPGFRCQRARLYGFPGTMTPKLRRATVMFCWASRVPDMPELISFEVFAPTITSEGDVFLRSQCGDTGDQITFAIERERTGTLPA